MHVSQLKISFLRPGVNLGFGAPNYIHLGVGPIYKKGYTISNMKLSTKVSNYCETNMIANYYAPGP